MDFLMVKKDYEENFLRSWKTQTYSPEDMQKILVLTEVALLLGQMKFRTYIVLALIHSKIPFATLYTWYRDSQDTSLRYCLAIAMSTLYSDAISDNLQEEFIKLMVGDYLLLSWLLNE
jgi:hypothetical protein